MESETSRIAEWRVDAREALRRVPTMLRGALTLALFVGGAYLIDQRSTYLGVLALSWSLLRVAASSRKVCVAHAFVLDHTIDLNCNARISLGLRMDNIIGHEAVRRLFDRLNEKARGPNGYTKTVIFRAVPPGQNSLNLAIFSRFAGWTAATV